MKKVELYDTTLRDGAQTAGISFSVADKIDIAQRLDAFGIAYIEGGWPGSNPKDLKFFERIQKAPLETAKIAAFGSTRRADSAVADDASVRALIEADTPATTIFGKTWDLHVSKALKTTLKENLAMIRDTVEFFVSREKDVIYDAEHFFDGYKSNSDYALETLRAAADAGARVLVLCDTNGGTLPAELATIMARVKKEVQLPLGIHAHNDADLAVANSVEAIRLGAVHVQGTINGFGERCGNANLCSIIPNLAFKMGVEFTSPVRPEDLTPLSHYVDELANLMPNPHQPYTGQSAFAHKGGVHIDAMLKDSKTYEHLAPERVGNTRRLLLSELAGKSSLIQKAKEFGLDLKKSTKETDTLLKRLKELEDAGYQFEGAEASFELLVKRSLAMHDDMFDLEGFRVFVEQRRNPMLVEATIRLKVGKKHSHTAATGDGPVNAMDIALRKALEPAYPEIRKIKLTDYKVRVLNATAGTAAKIRVLIESTDGARRWGTVGVSENIIEASWQALVDSIEYGLMLQGADGKERNGA